jgi:1,4-alpha-glucan branching enzyme
LEAAIALQLLSPHIPLLFMGEEVASRSPFLFFSETNEQLMESIREGRKREFKLDADKLPDPGSEETFEQSMPRPDPRLGPRRLRYYRTLLALRRERIAPVISGARTLGAHAIAEKAVVARWRMGDGSSLTLAINLGSEPVDCVIPSDPLLFESCSGAYEALASGTLTPNTTVALLTPGRR